MTSGSHVLIAVEDLELVQSLAETFTRRGSRVTAVREGGDLLQRLAEPEQFDLVVAATSMPLTSGLKAAHSGREVGVDIPLIVLAALRDPVLAARCRALGPRVVLLHEPFTAAAVEAAATSLLEAPHESPPAS